MSRLHLPRRATSASGVCMGCVAEPRSRSEPRMSLISSPILRASSALNVFAEASEYAVTCAICERVPDGDRGQRTNR